MLPFKLPNHVFIKFHFVLILFKSLLETVDFLLEMLSFFFQSNDLPLHISLLIKQGLLFFSEFLKKMLIFINLDLLAMYFKLQLMKFLLEGF